MNIFRAKQIAIELMGKHGLLELGWKFQMDNAKRRFGVCMYQSKRISLSLPLTTLNNEEKVTDTILHEIAHALVGNKHGHDWVWKQKALEIGCNGNRCYSRDEVETPKGNYVAICPNGHTRHRFKKPNKNQSCGKCSKKFNPNAILVWNKV